MRITPLDVRKQEFKKVMRGLDAEEVHAFLATVADEYEAVLLDNKQLRERILELDEKIQEYRHMEKTLRDTLMTAERVLAEARENARKEADLILKDAEVKTQQFAENHRRQVADMRREVVELHKEKEAFLARSKGLAEAMIQFIQNHRTDFEDLDRRLMGQAPRAGASRSAPAAAEEAPAPAARREGTQDVWRDYQPGVPAAGRAPAAATNVEPRRTEPEARPETWADVSGPEEEPRSYTEPDPRRATLAPEDVDELLEPLAAVQDEPAAAEPAVPNRAAGGAVEQAKSRERDETWNMESFTRDLGNL